MDKFGWQKPEIQPGMTGLQQAASARAMRRRAEKVDMIAAGNVLAEAREEMMKSIRIK
jgi:hypothetical protein